MAEQVTIKITAQDSASPAIKKIIEQFRALQGTTTHVKTSMDKAGELFRKAQIGQEWTQMGTAAAKANTSIMRALKDESAAYVENGKRVRAMGVAQAQAYQLDNVLSQQRQARIRSMGVLESQAATESARRMAQQQMSARSMGLLQVQALQMDTARTRSMAVAHAQALKMNAALDKQRAIAGRLVDTHGLLGLAIRRLALSVGVFIAYGGFKRMLEGMDEWQNMRNLIRVVTSSQSEMLKVQKDLFNVAQASRTGMQATTIIYTRLARSSQALGISQEKMLTITKAINQGFVVSGATAQEANAAMIQLSQGFASGVLRGDELRSVMEQASYLAMKLAEGLGIPYGKFRELSTQGKISIKQLTDALAKMAASIQRDFDRTTSTMEQGITKVRNSWGLLLDTMNRRWNISSGIAGWLSGLADSIESAATGVSELQLRLQRLQSFTGGGSGVDADMKRRFIQAEKGKWSTQNPILAGVYGGRSIDVINKELDSLTQTEREFTGRAAALEPMTGRMVGGRFTRQSIPSVPGTPWDVGKVRAEAEGYMERANAAKQTATALTQLLFLLMDEKKLEDDIAKTAKDRATIEERRVTLARELPRLAGLITGTGAKGKKFVGGIALPDNYGEFTPDQFEESLTKMQDWWNIYLENQEQAGEQRVEQLREMGVRYAGILDDIRMQIPADEYDRLSKESGIYSLLTGVIPTPDQMATAELRLEDMVKFKDKLADFAKEWKILELRAMGAAPTIGVRGKTAGQGFRVGYQGAYGTGLSGSILGDIKTPDYSFVTPLARTLPAVQTEMYRLIKASKKLTDQLTENTKTKNVDDFFFAWNRFGYSFRRMWFAEGGIFPTMGKAFTKFKLEIGTFTDIVYNATSAGLQTMRSGMQDAFSNLFGDNDVDEAQDIMRDVIGTLENWDLWYLTQGGKHYGSAGEWVSRMFQQMPDDLPNDVEDKLDRMRAEIEGLLANPTQANKDRVLNILRNLTGQLDGDDSVLGRLRQFGEDMANAIKDGFETTLTQALADATMKALLDLTTGVLRGALGGFAQGLGINIGKKTTQGVGQEVGSGISGAISAATASVIAPILLPVKWAWEELIYPYVIEPVWVTVKWSLDKLGLEGLTNPQGTIAQDIGNGLAAAIRGGLIGAGIGALFFPQGEIGAAIGGALGSVIGSMVSPIVGLFGSVVGSGIGGLLDSILNPNADAKLRNLQLTMAQRGGVVGALTYSGAEAGAGTSGFDLDNPELREQMKQAAEGGNYSTVLNMVSQALRTSMQIGERASNWIATMTYWNDTANMNQWQQQMFEELVSGFTAADFADLSKALQQLGIEMPAELRAISESLSRPITDAERAAERDAAIDALRNATQPPSSSSLAGKAGYLAANGLGVETAQGGGIVIYNTYNVEGIGDEALIRVFREKIQPEQERSMRKYLSEKSKYGQLEISNKVIRATIR